ncbi:MAG: DUF3305 domain-containing protein [Mangrovicoccus sp.]|nr:DUF3305 domain-containing protein [Mangrovicoccus sp.]
MNSIAQTEIALPMGLVVERRASAHPWAQWIWQPVAAYLIGESTPPDWSVLRQEGEVTRYHAGVLPLVLHRKDTEALRLNLMLPEPELYAVLQESQDSGPFPYRPHAITASSYEAQDYHDSGDDLIEKLPMPEPVAALIQAFVEHHHHEVPFKKRRRDRLDLEEQKFGKMPVFKPLSQQ